LEEVYLILQVFLVFFKDCYCWKVLLLHKRPEIHWLQYVCYWRSNECVCVCVCVYLFVCFCAGVFVCVCVFVGALAHRVGSIIFLMSDSGKYPFSQNGSHDCFLEVNNFGYFKLSFR
jgi:hypothetical protein